MSAPEAPHPIQDYEVYNESTDMEKKAYPVEPTDDPFGNEESGEVKYRIMPWWSVSHSVYCFYCIKDQISDFYIGKLERVRANH